MRESINKFPNTYFPISRLIWKKEWDDEVKFFFKYGVLLIGMLWIMKSEVFAFSIDSFQPTLDIEQIVPINRGRAPVAMWSVQFAGPAPLRPPSLHIVHGFVGLGRTA